MVHNLRHSIRLLYSNAGFTAIVVLALGLGLGANVALFTVVDGLLLQPLPPEELVEITQTLRGLPVEVLNRAQSFTGVGAFMPVNFRVRGNDGTKLVFGSRVTPNFFTVLGIRPNLGRVFTPGDRDVAMLGYEYWKRISGEAKIIGQVLSIEGQTYTVVGVLPAEFVLTFRDSDLWVPAPLTEGRVLGRLRPGVSLAQAEVEVGRIIAGNGRATSRVNDDQGHRLTPINEAFRSNGAPTFLLLQAAVGLVLLITCANIGNLMLVRATARRREFAIRSAIGAGRSQIVRQLLTEGALLAGLGCAAGLLIAKWSLGYLQTQLPVNILRALRGSEGLVIDIRVVLFAAGTSAVALLLFALAPALVISRIDLLAILKDSGKSSGRAQRRSAQSLAITEVALAVILLIGAGLVLKSLLRLEKANLGFDPEHVLRAAVDLPAVRYTLPEQRVAVFTEIVRRVQAIRGVETVGVLVPQFFPFGGPHVRGAPFEIEGRPDTEPRAEVYVANVDYFRSVRLPMLKGRVFTSGDTATSPPVAIVSEGIAKRHWANRDPVGSRVRLNPERAPLGSWVSIIGVAGDVRNPIGAGVQPTIYRPFAQAPSTGAILTIRTAADPLAIAPAVRKELQTVDPTAPETRTADLAAAISEYINPQKFTARLFGFFAAFGLLLATVGVYGVMRYWVIARIPEIGIRLALGARPADVVWLVLEKAALAALIGVALGVCGALALQRLIVSQLHGVTPTDPFVFAIVVPVAGGAALIAAYLPARSASTVDPLVALRHE